MKLTIQLKLNPTPEQADALRRTLETANTACDCMSQIAWETQTFRQFAIHRLTYQVARETFHLAAQLTVRCIAKVADAYKLDRKVRRTFAPLGAVAYDERILSYTHQNTAVSIWTLDGRQEIPFTCGDLTYIRTRIRARRSQRATLPSWSFAQLQAFIAYKAVGCGVPVHRVDPHNTSRTCPACAHCTKENRKTQASFICTSCGFAAPADVIAAENIRVLGRAAVNPPHCSDTDGSVAPEQSRRQYHVRSFTCSSSRSAVVWKSSSARWPHIDDVS